MNTNAIYSAAIALCDSKLAFLLLDAPPNVNTISAAVDWKTSGLTVNDPNGAAFFPRLRAPDPLNNYNLRTFAPCGVVAGVYAQTDATRGVWKAPAGTEATLNGVQGLVYKMSDAENGVLNPLGLNCFRTFPGVWLRPLGRTNSGGSGRGDESVEIRAGSARGFVPRGKPLPGNSMGGVRAQR